MYNVACLDSNDFQKMADGSKINELRRYGQPDPQLESVVRGEPILFLEMQSDRALLSRVVSIRRISVSNTKSTSFFIYLIRISRNRRLIELPMKRMPGWFRHNRKALAPLLKGIAA